MDSVGRGPVRVDVVNGVTTVKAVQVREVRKVRVNAEELSDPAKHAETIAKIQDNLEQATHDARHCPFVQGTLTEELTFTAGETKYVNHRLGREFSGVWIVYKTAYSDYKIGSLPSALSPSQSIPLTMQNADTFRFWVF